MSYARFSEGDVYVIYSIDGTLDCVGCSLQERVWVDDPDMPIFKGYERPTEPIIQTHFDSTQGMVDHLAQHRAAGHSVPEYLEEELWADEVENFGGTA